MKKFSFPLGRVMDWRDLQARIEESKLEGLYAELRAIDAQVASVLAARAQSDQSLMTASSTTGAELAAIDTFRRFSVAEHTRLDVQRVNCTKRVAAQLQVVAAKRRDVKLLDRLKQKRLTTWTADFNKEVDAQAEESHIGRFAQTRLR